MLLFMALVAMASPFLVLLSLDTNHALDKLIYSFTNKERRIISSVNQRHSIYKCLNEKQKKEFHWRIHFFLDTTDFVIKFKGDERKIKMVIAFAAAQISFALTIKSFDMLKKVIVYEDDYYSQINQRYHKGEFNPGAGILVFSWKSIEKGLARPDDGLNLLLHEFAHALRLEHIMMDYNIFDEDHFSYMDNVSKAELERMYATDDHFFRRYASTNIDEFFAVASENFFERATELKAKMPELYRAYKNLYQQDPASIKVMK
jgi:Mlc titration factor MtfA (ptsG expression regulator)